MAEEEVQGSVQGPNGESLSLKLGSKSIGLTTRDLIPVLLVIGVFVGGYLVVQSVTSRQDRGLEQLVKLLDTIHRNQTEMLAVMRDNREVTGAKLEAVATLVGTNRSQLGEEIRAQNQIVYAQTQELRQSVEAQTVELTRRLSILSWNMDREPKDRLPLNVNPESLPHPPRDR